MIHTKVNSDRTTKETFLFWSVDFISIMYLFINLLLSPNRAIFTEVQQIGLEFFYNNTILWRS